jgi:shikimate kinase
VIWLTAEPETVLARLSNDAASQTMRPQLTDLPVLEEIKTLLQQRSALYAETAHQIIETDHLRPVDIVERIRDSRF